MNFDLKQMIMNVARSNPQFKEIIDKIDKGENPETIYRELCKQKGINPDEFIKRFR